MNEANKVEARERWANQVEYVLSCLGYAVGIGNVWRFPYLCYRNGGGAFLVPYFLTLFLCGIPLVYLETSLGQFAGVSCISFFNITPLFKGAGYAVVVLNVIAVLYFGVIMAYAVLFMVYSVQTPLPWESCSNAWNTWKCVQLTRVTSIHSITNTTSRTGTITTPEEEFFYRGLLRMSDSLDNIGGIVWPVFFANAFSWFVVYLCICNGIKSVGKVVYFTVLFPYVVLSIMFVRGVTLPNAVEGLIYYLYPDWTMLKNPKVWADGAIQIFYSLGWISQSSVVVPLVNCGTSVFAGFVVFSVLGFAAGRANVSVGDVANGGPGLAFVTYPGALSMMKWSNLWAVLFFFMLFLLAVDTLFVTIEVIINGLVDEWPVLSKKKRLITFMICCILFCCSTICTTEGGMHVVTLLDNHVAVACVPLVCGFEIISVMYIYGKERFNEDMKFMTGRNPHAIWFYLWKYLIPVLIVIILSYTFWSSQSSTVIGWMVMMASVIFIPVYMLIILTRTSGNIQERIKGCCKTKDSWGPVDEEHKILWRQMQTNNIYMSSIRGYDEEKL